MANSLNWIPTNINYNLIYRRPTGYLLSLSLGVPTRSTQHPTINASGKTIREVVFRALGDPRCSSCGTHLVFEPYAECAFCSLCIDYLDCDGISWSNLKEETT